MYLHQAISWPHQSWSDTRCSVALCFHCHQPCWLCVATLRVKSSGTQTSTPLLCQERPTSGWKRRTTLAGASAGNPAAREERGRLRKITNICLNTFRICFAEQTRFWIKKWHLVGMRLRQTRQEAKRTDGCGKMRWKDAFEKNFRRADESLLLNNIPVLCWTWPGSRSGASLNLGTQKTSFHLDCIWKIAKLVLVRRTFHMKIKLMLFYVVVGCRNSHRYFLHYLCCLDNFKLPLDPLLEPSFPFFACHPSWETFPKVLLPLPSLSSCSKADVGSNLSNQGDA